MDRTKGLCCPGEANCLSGKVKDKKLKSFIIGSEIGEVQKRTLPNYCHNEVVSLNNAVASDGTRKMQGCPLFDTKPDGLPESLVHAIDTAEQFRKFKKLGLLSPDLDKISAFEFTCFDAAEQAVDSYNDEKDKEQNENQSTNQDYPLPTRSSEKTGGRFKR